MTAAEWRAGTAAMFATAAVFGIILSEEQAKAFAYSILDAAEKRRNDTGVIKTMPPAPPYLPDW